MKFLADLWTSKSMLSPAFRFFCAAIRCHCATDRDLSDAILLLRPATPGAVI
jgi:hypothetical protein